MSDRDEFERFVTDKFFDIEKDHIGYTSWATAFAWKVWQDTRAAARATQAVPALTDGCTEENCQRCRTPQELRTPDLRHAGIGSYPPDEPSASPPPETQIDVAPMYKALTESRLALLAVNSGASRKAIALIDAVLNAAPQPSQEPQRGMITEIPDGSIGMEGLQYNALLRRYQD